MILGLLALARTRKTTRSRRARLRGAALVLAGIGGELAAIWLRAGRLRWKRRRPLPPESPVHHDLDPRRVGEIAPPGPLAAPALPGRHWTLVTPVKDSELSDEQRHEAGEHRDLRLP
jgi:hypothetical protein